MLTLRPVQAKAFRRAARETFVDELARHLRTTLPEAVAGLDRKTLRRRVEWGVRRAAWWGLTRRLDVRGFVTLLFAITPDLESRPLVREVLTDDSIAPEEKLDVLVGRIAPGQWEAMRRSGDPTAWGRWRSGG